MTLTITPSGQACGATITGLDLSKPLSDSVVANIRAAWLEHHVLSFPDQVLSSSDLERFTLYFGGFGDDPYFGSIESHPNTAAIQRGADEKAPIFASTWHTDWSFQANPPSGTCLYGITIPPSGGDTLFANQHKAYEDMPDDLRETVKDLIAIHSAELAYAPDGAYSSEQPTESDRSMTILASEDARIRQEHPFVRTHPETGKPALYSTMGYILGFKGMDSEQSGQLLMRLYQYQGSECFQYRHKWAKNMLIMWDNRSVLHMATSGYEGHDRLLHRTTIAGLG